MLLSLDDLVPPLVPAVDPEAWVAPTAVVVGAVTLAAHVGVWYGSVVRADGDRITIGERTNVQDLCALHADPGKPLRIGSGVSVGHGAVLHGCTIEDEVLVGMGATVLNGAVIGAGSIVGARALVTEGTVVPPGSLVLGMPAKVAKDLGDSARARIEANAAVYQLLMERHRAARVLG